MSKVSLIWSVGLVFLLEGWLFTKAKIFIVLLILWIIRLLFLKDISVVLQVACISACFLIHFNTSASQVQKDQIERKNVNVLLKIHPDEIKVKEDGISALAFFNDSNGKATQVFIPIKDGATIRNISKAKGDIQVKVRGNIEPLDPPTNVNQFDFRRIIYGKRVHFKIEKCTLTDYSIVSGKSVVTWLHLWRKILIQRCQRLPNPLQSYCMGIILGEQTDYFKSNSEKLRNMGIIHLFCISGLHVFYLIQAIEKIAILIRVKREDLEIIQLIILPIYFILGGGSTSLFRAVMLVLVQLIAKRLHLPKQQTLEIWCGVLLVNLWVNPFVLLQMGGQLSYLLSLVLITSNTKSAFETSIKLFLIELPIIVFSTYKIHILTVLFNLIIVPVFSSIVVPITVLAFSVPLLAGVLNPLISLFEIILNFLDLLPGVIIFGRPALWIALLLLILALKISSTNSIKFKKWAIRFYCISWLVTWMYFKFIPFGEVTFFDVGQGDSILIRKPFNRSITLIDTGGKAQFGHNSQTKTIAKNSSINYLLSIGVSRIDNLCLTHQDMDHIGEASEILKSFDVKQLVFPVGVEKTKNFQRDIRPFIRKTKIIRVLKGTTIKKLPLNILYPLQEGKGENGDSLVLKGHFGKMNFLLTGDLDLEGEKQLIDSAGAMINNIDVFKLGHHGSKTANSEDLLKVIQPKLAVISAGRNNRYGHPNVEVMDRLKYLDIPSISTQKYGMISYRFLFNDVGRWITGIDERKSIVQ